MTARKVLKDLFDDYRRPYFSNLAEKVMPAIEMHQKFDLLGDPKWRNVTRHCLMEAARVEVIGDLIGLRDEAKKSLIMASALHDFYKKYEIRAIEEELRQGGNGWKAIYKSADEAAGHLQEAKFSAKIRYLVNGSGGNPETLIKVKDLLAQSSLTEDDWAFLIVYYVDSYTRGSSWVEAAGIFNDVDRRVDQNAKNPLYAKQSLNFHGKGVLKGKSLFQIMKQTSHMVEKRLVGLILEKSGIKVAPLKLPEFIDQEIKKRL